MTDPRDPRLKRQLDAFTTPDLPGDFADRMVALAMAEGEAPPPAAPVPVSVPVAKPRRLRLWLGGLALAGAGFASFSAAAMGYLGEPLRNAIHRVPIVHRLVERLAPRRHHPLVSPPVSAPVMPGPTAMAVPGVSPPPQALPPEPGPGPGLRRAAAAAAIWQARHPDRPLPRRFMLPPGAVRAAAPWAGAGPGAVATGPRLRLLRARRAMRNLDASGAAIPPLAVPPTMPTVPAAQPAAAHGEAPAEGHARPWRWWEQAPGEPLRRGRWRRGGAAGATPPPIQPAPSGPGLTQPEGRPPAVDTPRAHPPEPRNHPARGGRVPHPRGGGRRRH